MSLYLFLKSIHIFTAILSISGFFIRGIWMIQSSDFLKLRWVKITPHVIDTVLLLSAIALVVITSQYPGSLSWLNAKIAGLIVYIVLGSIALRYGKTKQIRVYAWCLALITFAYIVSVAYSKSALLGF